MKTSAIGLKIIAASVALVVVCGAVMLILPQLLAGSDNQAEVLFEWSHIIDLSDVVDEAEKE